MILRWNQFEIICTHFNATWTFPSSQSISGCCFWFFGSLLSSALAAVDLKKYQIKHYFLNQWALVRFNALTTFIPTFCNIQSFFNDLSNKHFRDSAHSDHNILRHGTSSDGLHKPLDWCFGECSATVHLVSVQLLFRKVWHENAEIIKVKLVIRKLNCRPQLTASFLSLLLQLPSGSACQA